MLQNHIKELKEDIKQLKASNKLLAERLTQLEEDLTNESDKESDISVGLESPLKEKQITKNHVNETTAHFKCCKCDFVTSTGLSLNKHINTKHPPKHDEVANIEESNRIEPDFFMEGIEDIEDMFQLEVVEDEQLFVCNICIEGFQKHDNIKKHIEKTHKDIIMQIKRIMDEEKCKDINNITTGNIID